VPIAAMIAPLFLGLVADRFFPSQIVMGILFLIGGVLMLIVPGVAAAGNGKLMVWLMLDALGLFRKPSFAVFLVCSCLICVPLAYYFGLTAMYLSNSGGCSRWTCRNR